MLLDSWRRVQTQQRNAPMIIAAIQILCGLLHRRRHGQVGAHVRWPELETGQWETQCRRALEELHEFPAEVTDGFVETVVQAAASSPPPSARLQIVLDSRDLRQFQDCIDLCTPESRHTSQQDAVSPVQRMEIEASPMSARRLALHGDFGQRWHQTSSSSAALAPHVAPTTSSQQQTSSNGTDHVPGTPERAHAPMLPVRRSYKYGSCPTHGRALRPIVHQSGRFQGQRIVRC